MERRMNNLKSNNSIYRNNLISLIVPTYNSRGKVQRLLESVERQAYNAYEVVFIDDGSSDGTYSFLRKYSLGNDKIRVYRKKHEGPGPARRLGYLKSKGDLLFFLDSDDWLSRPNTFAEINELFCRYPDIDACIAKRKAFPSDIVLSSFVGKEIRSGIYDLSIFSSRTIVGNMSTKIFRKEIVTENAFVGFLNYEDLVASYICLDKCKKIMCVNNYFYISNHSNDRNSLTDSKDYKMNTLMERSENIIKGSSLIHNKEIVSSYGSIALDVYCRLIAQHFFTRGSRTSLKELGKIINKADLSCFYPDYSLKKKIVLWIIKHGRIKK